MPPDRPRIQPPVRRPYILVTLLLALCLCLPEHCINLALKRYRPFLQWQRAHRRLGARRLCQGLLAEGPVCRNAAERNHREGERGSHYRTEQQGDGHILKRSGPGSPRRRGPARERTGRQHEAGQRRMYPPHRGSGPKASVPRSPRWPESRSRHRVSQPLPSRWVARATNAPPSATLGAAAPVAPPGCCRTSHMLGGPFLYPGLPFRPRYRT